MKCKSCPALRKEGYEYPEEYCALGVQDNETIEDREGNIGCRRRSLEKVKRDLETQDNIEAEAYAQFAQGMIESGALELSITEASKDWERRTTGEGQPECYKRTNFEAITKSPEKPAEYLCWLDLLEGNKDV